MTLTLAVFQVIASGSAAIDWRLFPRQPEITNYILVICLFGAALCALIFLREKFMLRISQ
jgi:hypothetical protein